jgi:hypothetical protein
MRLRKCMLISAMAFCVAMSTTLVGMANTKDSKALDNMKKQMDLQQERSNGSNGDYIPEQSSEPKVLKNEFLETDKKIGITNFWNSINVEEVEKYYINEDMSVSYKEGVTFATEEEKTLSDAKKENFEKELKGITSKVDAFNAQNGVQEVDHTDGNGGLKVGGLTGDGNGTNSLSVSGLVKGDILLLDDGTTHIYGAIMHAGMYDGSSTDMCIYSASPNDATPGVGWESVSDWRKNDIAWTVYVSGTTTTQRKDAWNTVTDQATWGEPYVWNSSKSNVDEWYCSKIPWYGYKNGSAGIDIDYDGGYWCLPVDIYNDNNTVIKKTFE